MSYQMLVCYVLLIIFLQPWNIAEAFSHDNPFAKEYYQPTNTKYEDMKGNMVQYRPGDILIGGIFRIHHSSEEKCGTIRHDGFQALEVMNMILDEVNNDTDVLPGVVIGSVVIDDCNMYTHAMNQIVKEILPLISAGNCRQDLEQTKLLTGLVGASSSSVSISTASLLQVFKLPQVSPWSTSPELSKKEKFPYFFRAVPSDIYQVRAAVDLFVKMEWKYISAIYEEGNYGINALKELRETLKNTSICLATWISIAADASKEEYDKAIDTLLGYPRAKVVLLITLSKPAEGMIKAADRNQESKGTFTWVGLDGWAGQLPLTANDTSYIESLNDSIAIQPMRSPTTRLKDYISGLSLENYRSKNSSEIGKNPWFAEYYSGYNNCSLEGTGSGKEICNNSLNINTEILAKIQNVADSVLAWIHSLNKYISKECKSSSGLCDSITNKSGTNFLATEVFEYLKNETFKGFHGNDFYFDDNHDGLPTYDYWTFYQNNNEPGKWIKGGNYTDRKIALADSFNRYTSLKSVCSDPCGPGEVRKEESGKPCCWACTACLRDEFLAENGTMCKKCQDNENPSPDRLNCVKAPIRSTSISDKDSVGPIVTSCLGIIFTITIAVIYYYKRDSPIVKASGKELCVCIWVGAIMCFINGFVSSLPANDSTCMASRFLVSLGLALQFAALLVKTVRVVIVFRAKAFLHGSIKRIIQPKYQILLTFLLLLFQIIVIGLRSFIDDSLTDIDYSTDNRGVVTGFRLCTDLYSFIVFVGLVYPFLLLIACSVLATMNRKVPEGFNETKVVGFTSYAVCVTWAAFIPIFIATEDKISFRVATSAISCNINSIITLLSLFGLRCYVILFKPNSNTKINVMERAPSRSGYASDTSRSQADKHSTVMTITSKNSPRLTTRNNLAAA